MPSLAVASCFSETARDENAWLRAYQRCGPFMSLRQPRLVALDRNYVLVRGSWDCELKTQLWTVAGQGDKIILRSALQSLGLSRAAAREKRAIQFGTKLAKLYNVRDYGSNRSAAARHAGTAKLGSTEQWMYWNLSSTITGLLKILAISWVCTSSLTIADNTHCSRFIMCRAIHHTDCH